MGEGRGHDGALERGIDGAMERRRAGNDGKPEVGCCRIRTPFRPRPGHAPSSIGGGVWRIPDKMPSGGSCRQMESSWQWKVSWMNLGKPGWPSRWRFRFTFPCALYSVHLVSPRWMRHKISPNRLQDMCMWRVRESQRDNAQSLTVGGRVSSSISIPLRLTLAYEIGSPPSTSDGTKAARETSTTAGNLDPPL